MGGKNRRHKKRKVQRTWGPERLNEAECQLQSASDDLCNLVHPYITYISYDLRNLFPGTCLCSNSEFLRQSREVNMW